MHCTQTRTVHVALTTTVPSAWFGETSHFHLSACGVFRNSRKAFAQHCHRLPGCPTIVSKALNLNCSYQPQSRIRRSNKTKSSWFHEPGGRSAQTFLAQVKYLTAALLTLGLPIAHWAGGGRVESPKTNGCYYLDAPKQFSQSLVS